MTYGRLEDTLATHRKVDRLARRMNVELALARGWVTGLWSVALRQAVDGDVSDWEPEEIEKACNFIGSTGTLFAALIDVGFIDRFGDGKLELHGFYERAKGLKEATRKRRERRRKRRTDCPTTITGSSADGRVTVTLERRGEERKGEEKKREEKEEEAPTAVAPAPPPSRVLLELACTGSASKSWVVTEAFVEELQASYETIDVLTELRKLQQWLLANQRRKPTAVGMRKRIVSWLNIAVDRAAAAKSSNVTTPRAPPLTAAEANLQRILEAVAPSASLFAEDDDDEERSSRRLAERNDGVSP